MTKTPTWSAGAAGRGIGLAHLLTDAGLRERLARQMVESRAIEARA